MSSYGVMLGLHFQRLMGVSQSWMNHLGLIGAFLRNTLIFPGRIRNMKY